MVGFRGVADRTERRRGDGGDVDATVEVDTHDVRPIRTTPPLPTRPVDARLVMLAGPQAGRRFSIDGVAVIGRAEPADIVLDEPRVSRLHARIEVHPDGARLEDLASRNGTFVNEMPVRGPVTVHFGSRIRIGGALLLLTRFDPIEEQLAQRQKYEAIGRLGTTIVHDLNNLLGAVLASADHLDRELATHDPDFGECRESVSDIREAIRRSAELVSRVLSFSKRGPSAEATVDFSTLAEDTMNLVRRGARRGVRAAVDVPRGIAVRGDRSLLAQLVYNLLVNARDALPPDGGDVTLSARVQDRADALVDLPRGPRSWVCIEVTDTGAGMTEDTLARMYEPFFTTKSPDRGSGLGLFIVFDAVHAHGGYIHCTSKLGAGTRFSVYLAAAESAAPVATAALLTSVETSRAGVVLVVDDEPTVRRSLRRVIQREGHEVVEAADGELAVEAARGRAADLDLVLLDLDMPNMDGREALVELRIVAPRARVVVLTGYCDDAQKRQLLDGGAIAVLEKPIEIDILRRHVAQAVGQKSTPPAEAVMP